MKTDRQIYERVSEIVFNGTPRPDAINQVSVCVFENGAVDFGVWWGKYLSGETSWKLPENARREIPTLFRDLSKYFVRNNLGAWNLLHFTISAHGKSFNAAFEFNEQVENGELTLWRYRKRFKDPDERRT